MRLRYDQTRVLSTDKVRRNDLIADAFDDGATVEELSVYFGLKVYEIRKIVGLRRNAVLKTCPILATLKEEHKYKPGLRCGFKDDCENKFKGRYKFCGVK